MGGLGVYSTRFLAWSSETTPGPYEVPAGYVLVLRDLDVYSGGGAIISWKLSVNDVATITGGQFTDESIPQTATWRGRQVLQAGEFLTFASDGATDGLASGYLLLDTL